MYFLGQFEELQADMLALGQESDATAAALQAQAASLAAERDALMGERDWMQDTLEGLQVPLLASCSPYWQPELSCYDAYATQHKSHEVMAVWFLGATCCSWHAQLGL